MFCYGASRYNMLEGITVSDMHRDIEKEREAAAKIQQYLPWLDEKGELLFLPDKDEERVYNLIAYGIEELKGLGQVFVSDSFKTIQRVQTPRVTVGVAMKAGLLDISIEGEGMSREELEGILAGYRKKRKFYRLADGSFLKLEENGLAAAAELSEGLAVKGEDLASGHLTVPAYRAFYLDKVLQENGTQLQVKRNQEFKRVLREMKNVEDSDFELPEELNAQLRPYQAFGFRWMMTLGKLGFGGILADDMGLGKTLQTIAYLLGRKELQSGYSALIVCPASLVYNWESEIHRFAPSLFVTVAAGTAAERKELLEKGEGDVLVTSYDLLKRDIELYENCCFADMIIDEAQNIKNYNTQAAKAVKAVKSQRRFALTGTPVENSLSELWSIFDFLMPGILSSNKQFKERYEQPIVNQQDQQAADRLRKMIRPYVLRRTKKEVLKELPDKLEKVVHAVMEGEQKKLYQASLQNLKESLDRQTEEEFSAGKIQILAELTRLRQICCDPAMIYENYRGGSAKTEVCMELLKTAASSGNQVLVFSQFTTALDLIGRRLEQEGISYYQLTGSTSKEKRRELVEKFNQDHTPVFLISLKAGGTGLNLTAASVVIHFDPWWNMAAQNQATDRAHRIGQKQVVTVYKLIMKDTLEEKILKLQEQKARLSDEIISEGSIKDALATREELLEILK